MKQNILGEDIYAFDSFTHQQALFIGIRAQQIAIEDNLKPIGIRVVYHNLLVFQYLMDGKKEDQWLKRKEKTVLESGHSSYYVFCHQENYQSWVNDDRYAVCGGGYPIIEKGECVGALCISGLKHDEDHGLIVRILKEMEESR